jgi:hypothetical protein
MFNPTLTKSSIEENEAEASKVLSSPNALVKDFLFQNAPSFARLDELRENVVLYLNSLQLNEADYQT